MIFGIIIVIIFLIFLLFAWMFSWGSKSTPNTVSNKVITQSSIAADTAATLGQNIKGLATGTAADDLKLVNICLLYTSPSPRAS